MIRTTLFQMFKLINEGNNDNFTIAIVNELMSKLEIKINICANDLLKKLNLNLKIE